MLDRQIFERSKTVWVVVADGRQARFYQYDRNKRVVPSGVSRRYAHSEEKGGLALVPVPDMTIMAEPRSAYDVDHTMRGTLFNGANPARNTCEPRLNVRDEIRQHLAQAIAGKLKEACARKAFDHLLLVMPPKMLGLLKKELDGHVAERVAMELPKDFVRYTEEELAANLKDALVRFSMPEPLSA